MSAVFEPVSDFSREVVGCKYGPCFGKTVFCLNAVIAYVRVDRRGYLRQSAQAAPRGLNVLKIVFAAFARKTICAAGVVLVTYLANLRKR
jgi:hypothetical protein